MAGDKQDGLDLSVANNTTSEYRYEDGRERSLSSTERTRKQLEEDIQRFLAQGGEIDEVSTVPDAPESQKATRFGNRPS